MISIVLNIFTIFQFIFELFSLFSSNFLQKKKKKLLWELKRCSIEMNSKIILNCTRAICVNLLLGQLTNCIALKKFFLMGTLTETMRKIHVYSSSNILEGDITVNAR